MFFVQVEETIYDCFPVSNTKLYGQEKSNQPIATLSQAKTRIQSLFQEKKLEFQSYDNSLIIPFGSDYKAILNGRNDGGPDIRVKISIVEI